MIAMLPACHILHLSVSQRALASFFGDRSSACGVCQSQVKLRAFQSAHRTRKKVKQRCRDYVKYSVFRWSSARCLVLYQENFITKCSVCSGGVPPSSWRFFGNSKLFTEKRTYCGSRYQVVDTADGPRCSRRCSSLFGFLRI